MKAVVDLGGPFAHAPTSVRWIMIQVLGALAPAVLFDLWLFGFPAINLFLVTIASALISEALCLTIAGKPLQPAITDGSAVLTGCLLAMSIPPWAPWWIGAIGALIGIGIGKHVFGGLGQNLFNPAMVARVALLISFPVPMTLFVAPKPLGSVDAPGFLDSLAITFGWHFNLDALSAATPLGYVKTELSRGVPVVDAVNHGASALDLAIGTVAGSMGETSAVLLLAGGLFLIWRRIIPWHIPVAMLGMLLGLATLFHIVDPGRFADGSFHLLAGATMLGAFFIATDLVTSPVTRPGQLVYGAGCGALVWIIRSFAGYPEGVAFAVLLMNALTPLIDRWIRPRIYGRTRRGDPLTPKPKT
ncbi:MAG: RnfABCDGE type electron transport complex subunit D [Azospirillum sp.]|nr:RnfABCDGE type electron transport complex subunit D [Azospirillum sp.]